MARKGFVPNEYGYREVLNGGPMFWECDRKGGEIARIASLGTLVLNNVSVSFLKLGEHRIKSRSGIACKSIIVSLGVVVRLNKARLGLIALIINIEVIRSMITSHKGHHGNKAHQQIGIMFHCRACV